MRTARALVLAVVLATTLTSPASADEVNAPINGSFAIEGHGWGHGRGMSQYGAQGAAQLGKTADQITAFYYPGTAKTVLSAASIRILIQGDEGTDTQVYAATGLKATDLANGSSATLPAGPTRWRVTRDSAGFHLSSLTGSTWSPYSLNGKTTFVGPVRFSGPALVRLALPGGGSRDYRTAVQAAYRSSTTLYTVAVMSMEDYLFGVVPRESSSSWPAAALQAQSIAARSYAAYKREHAPSNQTFDICDTTQCQVFGGTNAYSASGTKTPQEAASTNDAVLKTRGVVRTYQGASIFSEFSASNGGWSVKGDVPYLVAQQDPYDGVTGSSVHSWTATLTAAQLQARYPAVGTLKRMRVTLRDGNGEWGGRVKTVVLEGVNSSGQATSVTTTGAGVYNAHSWPGSSTGLRSSWWHVKGSLNAAVVTKSAAPTLVQSPGLATQSVTVQLKNTGSQAWPVSGTHLTLSTNPGTQDPLAGGSTRPGTLIRNVTRPEGQIIAVGEVAEFRVTLTGNAVPVGTHTRNYRVRITTGNPFGPVVSWVVPVVAPTFTAKAGTPTGSGVLSDGRTVVLPRSSSSTVTIPSTNTSNVTWPVSSRVRLATAGDKDSPSVSSTWVSPHRPAALAASAPVAPTKTGTYRLVLKGNNRPVGTTIEAFEPVWDGESRISGARTSLFVVRTDPAVSRLAERVYTAPKVSLLNAPSGTTTVRVRLRNVGGSAWSIGQEGLTTTTASPFVTSAWASSSRPPALRSNLSRPTGKIVQPGEIGEWLVPLSAFKVKAGSYTMGLRPVGPSGAYGPTSTVSVTVKDAVLAGTAVAVHPAVTMTSTGTAQTWFDVKNTGNVNWALRSSVRSASLVSGGSPSRHSSWISPTRPGPVVTNLTRPAGTFIAPGETGRFSFLLAGNGRSARTTSELFGLVWDGWRSATLRVTIGYRITG